MFSYLRNYEKQNLHPPKNKPFKERFSLTQRINEANKVLEKYPNRYPVIVEKGSNSDNVPDLDRHKFLVPSDLSLANLMYIIRKRIKLSSEKSLYLFIGGSFAPTSKLLLELYEKHKDEDGFLYVTYTGESTFG